MKALQDTFGREHNYLRISLTDKCNLRCHYCMPANPDFMQSPKLMSPEEIAYIGSLFVNEYGINKIRLTGGEPLARKDFPDILKKLSKLETSLHITTNGILLNQFWRRLKLAGITSVNISLDTLKKNKFKQITRIDAFEKVIGNINQAIENFIYVKLNVVAMKGVNDDEILNFVKLTKHLPIHVRFIEFMPFAGNQWKHASVIKHDEIIEKVRSRYDFEKVTDPKNSTAQAFRIENAAGTFAIIGTISNGFCSSCNRIRITADGKIRNCLFDQGEIDLLTPLRKGNDIKPLIEKSILSKHAKFGGLPDFKKEAQVISKLDERSMLKIGG
ncbi:MAG TPA: GTP 3',8-cyclase MoaA [Bacteroidetes bacterium]|nr:GTP 3',8-cyclase MoaA [Bacteroidota bacterium]